MFNHCCFPGFFCGFTYAIDSSHSFHPSLSYFCMVLSMQLAPATISSYALRIIFSFLITAYNDLTKYTELLHQELSWCIFGDIYFLFYVFYLCLFFSYCFFSDVFGSGTGGRALKYDPVRWDEINVCHCHSLSSQSPVSTTILQSVLAFSSMCIYQRLDDPCLHPEQIWSEQ